MKLENNNTAETGNGQTDHGNIITIETTLGDEDEDVHKCGRCQEEFSLLEAFIQHKLRRSCQRSQEQPNKESQIADDGNSPATLNDSGILSSVEQVRPEDPDKAIAEVSQQATSQDVESSDQGVQASEGSDGSKLVLRVNDEGRFVCQLCEKTFKTPNILRTHMSTHSEKKDFHCDLCGTSFRTKGSLIRHNRRHTDERPYRCNLCGLSFRESGALTRHMKSITPCTEKIRFSQCKEILVGKDGVRKVESVAEQQTTSILPQTEAQPVQEVSVVEETQELIHIQMVQDPGQAQQEVVQPKPDPTEESNNLICQAIINSGIALEADASTETDVEPVPGPVESRAAGLALQTPETESRVPDIQLSEECVEMEDDTALSSEETSEKEGEPVPAKLHKCPHCNRVFKALNYLRFHVKGHLGYKPFKCMVCQKEFLTGYLLKKHMEVHLSERRYKCGECGKLYKTIGHVREHMRAHSDERPFHCNRCDKAYKTKNALQVHQRTHGQDKPYVCPHCTRGFREKGSLVRHIRHHTGEKPFKCPKCSRGFAEHGTLNRHLRSKGGCHTGQRESEQAVAVAVKEQQVSAESMAAIITEDPHAVLVEFSSVVADTQEYIIRAAAEESVQTEEVALLQDTQSQMGSQIMKVVQQIVSQSQQRGGGGRQIIVRNVVAGEDDVSTTTATISDSGDTITIATPESLTEQVALTLASAIGDGTILTAAAPETTVTMVTEGEAQEVEVMEQEQFVIAAIPDEMEIQTVVV
ncbi:transcription factor E4F1 isoform X1 [Alosa sapidissima]|uniref:transcription factor E4F1 isoform X1 n=1 Tax=Alosa sapidissima TaxID=34773 RepID=UPI001C08914E|nr:transcription factor E4F1 isoform X1 [Alosa sapidissima]